MAKKTEKAAPGPRGNELIVRAPYDGSELARLSFDSDKELKRALDTAVRAYDAWRTSTGFQRAKLLNDVAGELESRVDEFATLMAREAGKPLTYARGECERALGVLRWAAGEAQRFSGELLRLDAGAGGRAGFGIHTRFPRGVILGITPFNFPLNLVIHKVAPAVASGNAILIKPSPATPLTAQKLASLFEARVPGLVQVVLADDEATERLTRAHEIKMVSFTGSARVGALVRKQAFDKPVTLELGGNAWVIVMEDTPQQLLPAIAKRIANAAYGYAGQSCISVQNAAVAPGIWPKLRDLLAETTRKIPYGDPESAKVISGPLIRKLAADRVRSTLEDEVPRGATLHQSKAREGKDSPLLVPPSLVTYDTSAPTSESSDLVQEEIFGPVMTARKFGELPELIKKINSSRYGLQAGVFTQNWAAIETLYRELQVGGLVVNDVPTTRYDHQPYGGVKDSGQGREGVRYAMEEMTESKFLALSSQVPL